MATSRERARIPPSPPPKPPTPLGPVLGTMDLPHGLRAIIYGYAVPTGGGHRNPADRA
ncbi:MAG: hypothetical protein ACREQ5_02385 [Candidatus Dormibacteria bacterium]